MCSHRVSWLRRAPTRHVHKASSVTAVTRGQDIVCRTASGEARRECLASAARASPRPTEAERLRESVRIAAAIQLVPLPRGGQESVQISNDTTSAGNLQRLVGPSSPTTSSSVHRLTPARRGATSHASRCSFVQSDATLLKFFERLGEQIVLMPRERSPERTVEQIVVVPVPRIQNRL